jgi:D-alanyl-D-alanine endopeptidase (penicillin-binding protein 7)
MIVDLNTNQVIYASHPDLVRPIASITKLMTAMVVLDASAAGRKTESGY